MCSRNILNDKIKRGGTLTKCKKGSQSEMANHGIVKFVNKYKFVLLPDFFLCFNSKVNVVPYTFVRRGNAC